MQYIKIYGLDVALDTVFIAFIWWLLGTGIFINKVMGFPLDSSPREAELPIVLRPVVIPQDVRPETPEMKLT